MFSFSLPLSVDPGLCLYYPGELFAVHIPGIPGSGGVHIGAIWTKPSKVTAAVSVAVDAVVTAVVTVVLAAVDIAVVTAVDTAIVIAVVDASNG